jgi:hypothetical protein
VRWRSRRGRVGIGFGFEQAEEPEHCSFDAAEAGEYTVQVQNRVAPSVYRLTARLARAAAAP